MSLIGNIDNIPLFTTIREAELWGQQYGLTGYHTHTLLGQLGYMGGTNHAEITQAVAVGVQAPLSPNQVRAATQASITTTTTTSSGGGGGGY